MTVSWKGVCGSALRLHTSSITCIYGHSCDRQIDLLKMAKTSNQPSQSLVLIMQYSNGLTLQNQLDALIAQKCLFYPLFLAFDVDYKHIQGRRMYGMHGWCNTRKTYISLPF
jgi:hypothetical protein